MGLERKSLSLSMSEWWLPVFAAAFYVVTAALVTSVGGDCSGGWRSNFGNEYCADTELLSFASANASCQNRSSELVSISSDAECDYVASLV